MRGGEDARRGARDAELPSLSSQSHGSHTGGSLAEAALVLDKCDQFNLSSESVMLSRKAC